VISKDVEKAPLREDAGSCVNEARSCEPGDAPVTQGCSPVVPARSKRSEGRKRKLLAKRWRRLVNGKIYFARAGEAIKIGFSTKTEERIASLQTAHFDTLHLLAVIDGSQKDERALHHKFRHLHIRGEWFRAEPDLIAHIDFLNGKPAPEPIRATKVKVDLPPDQASTLTGVRGVVRRLPEGVKKEQFSLLAAMIENGRPPHVIAGQLALISA
jgi:hypothetical protein